MNDTELAMLEQGPRVALAVMPTDQHAMGGVIRYLWWRGWTTQQIAFLAISGVLRRGLVPR